VVPSLYIYVANTNVSMKGQYRLITKNPNFTLLRPSESGRPIPYIDQIALGFPDLKNVCGHIGYP